MLVPKVDSRAERDMNTFLSRYVCATKLRMKVGTFFCFLLEYLRTATLCLSTRHILTTVFSIEKEYNVLEKLKFVMDYIFFSTIYFSNNI